ncbi:sugar phosphate isomerase/epimerase [uncultured Oscillibacter sp.]|uniref:sugar phosphate isomerase/epimerase family protein n=1 Tax=uncultured Oscillibacter sp. TaxID=876091 RepID=UPI00280512CA|nr:sugar phosphate isomerase/epimerase [uncultured Oscillibacter sp.]
MKLGLVTDSLAAYPLERAAAICRELGLEQVELGCGNWSPAPHVDLKQLTADAGARRRLLDILAENGLAISALNCSGNPLFPGEKGERDRAVAADTFLLAEQLGLDTVVMMSGLPGGCPEDRTPTWIVTSWPPETEEILRYQWQAAVPVWRGLAARARDHGVRHIALEFHGWQLVYNVETLRRLQSEVGGDLLGVNLDPSHLFWMGADPLEVAKALADCIYHVHIKDVRLEPAAGQNTLLDTKGVLEYASRSWNFVTPGSGHGADWWRAFLRTLRECGYDGALSIEQEDYTIPLEEALKKAVSLLRQVLPS